MMELETISKNCNELTIGRARDGVRILFSYKTPVAAYFSGRGFSITEEKFSSTTSRHITKWLESYGKTRKDAELKPQTYFNTLLDK